MGRINEKKKKHVGEEVGWDTAHFPILVTTQCVVPRQAGCRRALGRDTAWPANRGEPQRASETARRPRAIGVLGPKVVTPNFVS